MMGQGSEEVSLKVKIGLVLQNIAHGILLSQSSKVSQYSKKVKSIKYHFILKPYILSKHVPPKLQNGAPQIPPRQVSLSNPVKEMWNRPKGDAFASRQPILNHKEGPTKYVLLAKSAKCRSAQNCKEIDVVSVGDVQKRVGDGGRGVEC
jgi:hypothetical protein